MILKVISDYWLCSLSTRPLLGRSGNKASGCVPDLSWGGLGTRLLAVYQTSSWGGLGTRLVAV